MKKVLGIVVSGVLIAGLATAQTASISMGELSCLPSESNGVTKASVTPEVGGTTTRTYFRNKGDGAFYFVDMKAAGGGNYWGVLPRPESDTAKVEYYSAIEDPHGNTLARSDTSEVDATADCVVDLTPEEQGVANNLTVGETSAEQSQKPVSGFLCEGVVTRMGSDGVIRGDEICRRCIVALWRKAAAIPILGVAGCMVGCRNPRASEFLP
jgi:hypothetical protein